MDATIRINDGKKILTYSWDGSKLFAIDYPDDPTTGHPRLGKPLTMIASVSSSKGYFAWLSSDSHLLITESLTDAHLWVPLKDPLIQHRFRYHYFETRYGPAQGPSPAECPMEKL